MIFCTSCIRILFICAHCIVFKLLLWLFPSAEITNTHFSSHCNFFTQLIIIFCNTFFPVDEGENAHEFKFQDVPFSSGTFVEISSSKPARNSSTVNKVSDAEKVPEEKDDMAVLKNGLFSCPIEGCVKTFEKYSNLEKHMFYAQCNLVTERECPLDQAKIMYRKKLLEGVSQQPHIHAVSTLLCTSTAKSLEKGWALKTSKGGKTFNTNQKSYLDEKFRLGQNRK